MREQKRGFDAAPAQIGFGNALTDCLLKSGNAVGLDLLAFGFFGLALDAEFVFLNHVILFGLPVNRRDDVRRQLDREHQRVEDLDRVLEKIVIVLRIRLLHGLGLHQLVEVCGQASLRRVANLFLDLLARRIDRLGGILRNDLPRLTAHFRIDH